MNIYKWNYHDQKIQQKHTSNILNRCFNLIGSHQQYIPWFPPLEIKSASPECRNRTSTNGPPVHATQKRPKSTSHGKKVRPHDLMRPRFVLLMSPNKVETPLQCSVCHRWVFAGFSCHGNLINIISIHLIIYIYIYIYIYVYIFKKIVCSELDSFKCCYPNVFVQNISHLFAHS